MAQTVPKQRYQGIQKESAGYRLMAAMGWKEGEGLGASKQGIKEHIRVKKNFENWGVGAITAADRARDWSTGMADFHRVLSTLSEITSQHAEKNSESGQEDSDNECDDDSKMKSQNEKRKTKKKDKKKKDKSKKKKREEKDEQPLSDVKKQRQSTIDDVDVATDPALNPKRVKIATHVGRFKKRENAKMVKNYSTHDLAAILGEDPFASIAAQHQSSNGQNHSVNSEDDENDDRHQSDGERVRIGNNNAMFTKGEHHDGDGGEGENVSQYWWSAYFVRRGKMGSLRRSVHTRARGFSEQDQTDLYNNAHDGATQGRVGLGRSSMPKKVAGVRWEGKKVILDSDDEEGEGSLDERNNNDDKNGQRVKEGGEMRSEEEEDEMVHGVVVVLPDGRKQEKAKQKEIGELMKEILGAQKGKSMKIRSVQKSIMEKKGWSKKEAKKFKVSAWVEEALSDSEIFRVDKGKIVTLLI